MNYISSQSFHTLTHWQSGNRGEKTEEDYLTGKYHLFLQGAISDNKLYLFPYQWHENTDYEKSLYEGWYGLTRENALTNLYWGGYVPTNSTGTEITAIGIYGPVETYTIGESCPADSSFTSELTYFPLTRRAGRLYKDGEETTLTLTPDYIGGSLRIRANRYIFVTFTYNADFTPEISEWSNYKSYEYPGYVDSYQRYLLTQCTADNKNPLDERIKTSFWNAQLIHINTWNDLLYSNIIGSVKGTGSPDLIFSTGGEFTSPITTGNGHNYGNATTGGSIYNNVSSYTYTDGTTDNLQHTGGTHYAGGATSNTGGYSNLQYYRQQESTGYIQYNIEIVRCMKKLEIESENFQFFSVN